MNELLALPQWNAEPKTLQDWVDRLTEAGYPPVVDSEAPDVVWLEIASLRTRGYAVIEGGQVTAINFELAERDADQARDVIQAVAVALGWEVHADSGEGPDDDDDE